MNPELPEKREHTRLILSYPLELTLFSPDLLDKSFIGYIKDLSTKGACIQLEDKYNRFDIIDQTDSWIDLEINVPPGERISLNTRISWIRKNDPRHCFSILIGLEFKELNELQLEQIDRLVKTSKIDNQMIHVLFDHHIEQISM